MKLISNWKDIALNAHSMWAQYLGLSCLTVPEMIYLVFEVDTNPRLWWIAGVLLLVWGIIGRIRDQGIDRSKTNSPWAIAVVAVFMAGVLMFGQVRGPGNLDNMAEPQAAAVQPAADPVAAYDAAFLEMAVPFIGGWEGLRLEAYLDVVGVPTVCYGETKGVKLGDSYSKAECDAMLAREVIAYRDNLRPAFSEDTMALRMPLKRDVAFTDLAYNVGVARSAKSTAVKRLNKADIAGACDAMGWFNRAGGRVLRGLINRRSAASVLCLDGLA